MVARIPARSRRQAMDWSLVLLSQGIESVIEVAGEGPGWGLVVPASLEQRALESIRAYQQENRRWPWRRQLSPSGPFIDWASLVWALLACFFYWLSIRREDLRAIALMDNAAVSAGEWWRLFTATWLHADLGHLAANLTVGVVLLGLVMWRYGTGPGLLAASLTGAGGNLLVWLASAGSHHSLGASGMVMGNLGLLAVQSASLYTRNPRTRRHLLTGLFAGVMLFVLFGLAPDTDVLAHLGGFLTGLALGTVMASAPQLCGSNVVNSLACLAFATLVIWPWSRAILHA